METLNHCEINVVVAEIGAGSWKLKSEKDAHEKMSGKEGHLHALMSNKYIPSTIGKYVNCRYCILCDYVCSSS